MRCLLIIDVQNDFMTNGSLEVPHATKIIPFINSIQSQFTLVVATQDWHPAGHKSFASNNNVAPFSTIQLQGQQQTAWPDHCVKGSFGAQLHSELNCDAIAAIFRKGMDKNVDSYSAFFDNNHTNSTGLAGYLHDRAVSELHICGLCSDICVYYSLLDAVKLGFNCIFVEYASTPLNPQDMPEIKQNLIQKGVRLDTRAPKL